MATQVFTDAYLSVGGTDLSDHVQSVTLEYSAELQDDTAMGDTARSRKGGLKDWTVSVTFFQDRAASEVDATLFSLVGTSVALVLQGDNNSGTATSTNPTYTGNAILAEYQPMGGDIGSMEMAPVTFNADGALTRNTA